MKKRTHETHREIRWNYDEWLLKAECPRDQTVMIGSGHCKTKCSFFVGIEGKNVVCTYSEGKEDTACLRT